MTYTAVWITVAYSPNDKRISFLGLILCIPDIMSYVAPKNDIHMCYIFREKIVFHHRVNYLLCTALLV